MTLKEKCIKRIQQLPEDILKQLYFLELIDPKGLMQYNKFLADRYRKHKILSSGEDWIEFKIGEFRILMEAEED